MNNRVMIALIAAALLICGSAVVLAEDAPEKAAQKAAEGWMLLWDAGKCDESYQELAEHTRKNIPKRQWFVYWSAVRKPLGKLKSRKLIEAKYVKSLPAVPSQEGAMLQYESSFEHKESVIETFGMMREKDGTWRVANYLTKEEK